MYSTIRKTLLTGVLAVALACGYGCKSDELRKKELDILELQARNKSKELELKEKELAGDLEKKVDEPRKIVDKTKGVLRLPVAPAGRKTPAYTPEKKEGKQKCYLRIENFEFCQRISKKNNRCINKGREFGMGMGASFKYYLVNGPRSIDGIKVRYVIRHFNGKKIPFAKVKGSKMIRNGTRRGFKGNIYYSSDLEQTTYYLGIRIKEKGTGCILRGKKRFDMDY